MAASAARRLAAPVATLLVSSLLAGCIIIEDDPPPRSAARYVEPVSTLATDEGMLMRCKTSNIALDYKITRTDIGWSPVNQNRWTPRFCNTGERPRMQGTINTVCNLSLSRAWSMTMSIQPFGNSVVEEEIRFDEKTIVVTSSIGNKPATTRRGTCHRIDAKGRPIED